MWHRNRGGRRASNDDVPACESEEQETEQLDAWLIRNKQATRRYHEQQRSDDNGKEISP